MEVWLIYMIHSTTYDIGPVRLLKFDLPYPDPSHTLDHTHFLPTHLILHGQQDIVRVRLAGPIPIPIQPRGRRPRRRRHQAILPLCV